MNTQLNLYQPHPSLLRRHTCGPIGHLLQYSGAKRIGQMKTLTVEGGNRPSTCSVPFKVQNVFFKIYTNLLNPSLEVLDKQFPEIVECLKFFRYSIFQPLKVLSCLLPPLICKTKKIKNSQSYYKFNQNKTRNKLKMNVF
jgi:hypothetical protein